MRGGPEQNLPFGNDFTQREQNRPDERWGPPHRRSLAYASVAAIAAGLALAADGGPLGLDGGVAFTVLAVLAAAAALTDLWWDDVLVADDGGIGVRTGSRRREHHPWGAVRRIEARTTTRGLLRLSSLELDVRDEAGDGDRLLLLSRHRLGADPEQVAERLRQRRRAAG